MLFRHEIKFLFRHEISLFRHKITQLFLLQTAFHTSAIITINLAIKRRDVLAYTLLHRELNSALTNRFAMFFECIRFSLQLSACKT